MDLFFNEKESQGLLVSFFKGCEIIHEGSDVLFCEERGKISETHVTLLLWERISEILGVLVFEGNQRNSEALRISFFMRKNFRNLWCFIVWRTSKNLRNPFWFFYKKNLGNPWCFIFWETWKNLRSFLDFFFHEKESQGLLVSFFKACEII